MQRSELLKAYSNVRKASVAMCQPLEEQDYWAKQPMAEVSPPGWNLGHTSWFFRNVIERFGGPITKQDKEYGFYLNSYYSVLGERIGRANRGDKAWISLDDLLRYRNSVDERISRLILHISAGLWPQFLWNVILGLQHERQHQELFYTEIKYFRFREPRQRPYQAEKPEQTVLSPHNPQRFVFFSGGLHQFGNLEGGWCFDNELDIHEQLLCDYSLGDRLVTNAEYLEFIEDGGYKKENLWQADGWAKVRAENWQAPLYWEKTDQGWQYWTLYGWRSVDSNAPLCHVSFWEAESYCHWRRSQGGVDGNLRLPTEYEWEHAARFCGRFPVNDNQMVPAELHPAPYDNNPFSQMFRSVWEWTASVHLPYPHYRPFAEPFSEYTSKFFYSSLVLRGGSCVSAPDHLRVSYRNYWSPETRFQFSGIRLAQTLD